MIPSKRGVKYALMLSVVSSKNQSAQGIEYFISGKDLTGLAPLGLFVRAADERTKHSKFVLRSYSLPVFS